MGFKFKEENSLQARNRILMNRIDSISPIYRSRSKREELRCSEYWGMELFYYFLEKLLKKIGSKLDLVADEWATRDWEIASKLVDDPGDLLEGLKKIQGLSQKHCPEELEHIANVIEIFTDMEAAK